MSTRPVIQPSLAHGHGLPPYSAYRPSGEAPRLPASALGLGPDDLRPGLAGVSFPEDEPLCLACDPTPLEQSQLVSVSPTAAALLNLRPHDLHEGWQALLSGEAVIAEQPSYATVYAGHQFGVFVPRLGDGRALNIGQVRGWELQLKGAGSTPYARHADGRAVLRSSVREFLCSEAMAALGVPTTRALSLVTSTSPVFRERPEPGAVVCRMAPSFVRFGHFEYLAMRRRPELAWALMDHLIETQPSFAACRPLEGTDRASAFFAQVMTTTAALMAHWTAQGFMHGVMNTDNFSILGLTLDYGPYGWMEGFEAQAICNHSDHSGRYRFAHQPAIGLWNLERLLAALSQMVTGRVGQAAAAPWVEEWREELMARYETAFQSAFHGLLADRLGVGQEDLAGLLDGLYPQLQRQQIDYPRFMRALGQSDLRLDPSQVTGSSASSADHPQGWQAVLDECPDRDAMVPWLLAFRAAALAQLAPGLSPTDAQQLPEASLMSWKQARNQANPAYVLRNWVAEEVIRALEDEQNPEPLNRALRVFSSPFEDHPDASAWRNPPPDWAKNLSLSCSS